MFTTAKTRSGKLTLFFNGISIHSRYDPVLEAQTFLKQHYYNKKPFLFILIGPGLGFLKTEISINYPSAKLLSLHLDRQIYELSTKIGKNWYYGENKQLSLTLAEFIPDFQLLETSIIKWSPCTKLFPDRTKNIESIIHQFFLERKGSVFTTGSFGRTWLRNINLNIFTKRKLLILGNIDSTIIITASGPSLSKSLILLKKNRKKYTLAALSSSLPALNNAKILPDFIFHTDPGYWAKEHLNAIPNIKIPIIMPLTSSFYSKLSNPVILINQGSFFENFLLKDNFSKISSHGTVAGTAYLFFRGITQNPIIFIGLDLCYDDVKEHVSPHSFDTIFDLKQNRLNGYLNIIYGKQQSTGRSLNNIKTNTAFSTYSGWFNNKYRLSNCFRYNSSPVITEGLKKINTDKLLKLINTSNNTHTLYESTNNNNLIKTEFIIFLKKIILNLQDYKSNIEIMTYKNILTLFTTKNILIEIFQYVAYPDILELSRYYRTNPVKSRKILLNIYCKSFSYISTMLDRYNYD